MVRRKKIAKFLSNDDTNQEYEKDSNQGEGERPYTREEIVKLLEFSDLREKVIILLMSSSGMRIGALPLLRISDLVAIPKYNLYQIRVYANSKSSRHYTFCTPECRKALDNYIEFRRSCGENITAKSPLLRREFDKRDIFQVANDIKPLTRASIKTALIKVLYASRLRTPFVTSKLNNRRPTAMSHGFRKFFDTTCTHSGMNQTYIEFCLGHKLPGVKDSYFLPQPDSNGVYLDLLEGHDKNPGYIDAIDFLTINEENRLRRKVDLLTIEKSKLELLEEKMNELDRRLGFVR
jgi:integrase